MSDTLQTLAGGGQTWIHRVRMLRQVFRIALILSLFGTVSVFTSKIAQEPKQRFCALYYYLKTEMIFSDAVEVSLKFSQYITGNPQNARTTFNVEDIRIASKEESIFLWDSAKVHLKKSGIWGAAIFFGFLIFFLLRGRRAKKKKIITGKEVKKRRMRKFRAKGGLRLGQAVLSKKSENLHMLISGGTGSGKTNAINHLLPQIRKRGQKVLIVDTTSRFISTYYNPKKDHILNPFDARSEKWHPWADCREIYDFEEIANDFIPSSSSDHDPFWKDASRTVFESLLEKGQEAKDLPHLCDMVMNKPLKELSDYLKGTRGAVVIGPEGEKTAHSIRAQASGYLKSLRHFKRTATPFSIHDWICSDKEDSCLFLACTKGQRSTLVRLISVWFAIALRASMTLKDSTTRRIWMINDELPSMGKIESLGKCLAEGRSSGICALLAVQSPAQIDAIYGNKDAKTIKGQLSTKICFREIEAEIAEEVSRQFGKKEVQEPQEGISYGANDMRDGVNQSMQTRQRPVISATQIQGLKQGECFLLKPDGSAIEQIKLKRVDLPKIAKIFEKQELSPQEEEKKKETTMTEEESHKELIEEEATQEEEMTTSQEKQEEGTVEQNEAKIEETTMKEDIDDVMEQAEEQQGEGLIMTHEELAELEKLRPDIDDVMEQAEEQQGEGLIMTHEELAELEKLRPNIDDLMEQEELPMTHEELAELERLRANIDDAIEQESEKGKGPIMTHEELAELEKFKSNIDDLMKQEEEQESEQGEDLSNTQEELAGLEEFKSNIDDLMKQESEQEEEQGEEQGEEISNIQKELIDDLIKKEEEQEPAEGEKETMIQEKWWKMKQEEGEIRKQKGLIEKYKSTMTQEEWGPTTDEKIEAEAIQEEEGEEEAMDHIDDLIEQEDAKEEEQEEEQEEEEGTVEQNEAKIEEKR